MTDGDDDRGPPDACPACGGDVVDSPVGYVCDDCGAWVASMNTRGRGQNVNQDAGQNVGQDQHQDGSDGDQDGSDGED